jgi:hypothetical protein
VRAFPLRNDQGLSFRFAQGANRRGPVTPSVVLVARLFTRGGALVSIIAEKFWADPTQINPWPASQKFGGILWANSDGMEEVIGSIPIRSTNQPLYS